MSTTNDGQLRRSERKPSKVPSGSLTLPQDHEKRSRDNNQPLLVHPSTKRRNHSQGRAVSKGPREQKKRKVDVLLGASREARFPQSYFPPSGGRESRVPSDNNYNISQKQHDELDCIGDKLDRRTTPARRASIRESAMTREGNFSSNTQTPVPRSESPLSSLTASTARQQDGFSETVQTFQGHGTPADEEHETLAEGLRSSRDREEILEHKLVTAEAGQEVARRELQKAISELEQARVTIQQQLLGKLKQANDDKMELEGRILIQGGTNASATTGSRNAGATDALAVAPQKISLGVFDNVTDRVPEVSVMSNVDNINEALEDLVSDVLDDAAMVRTSASARRSVDPRKEFNSDDHCLMPILNALTMAELTEANRGLLLAAFFHHVVIELLHSLIFCGEGATFTSDETAILNKLFDHVSQNESWIVSQRWRAILASHLSEICPLTLWEHHVQDVTQRIIECIAWAHSIPFASLDAIKQRIVKDLTVIFRDAHELSVVTKRDILSTRISVAIAPSLGSFDPRYVETAWSGMDAEAGDDVLGHYSLGLVKRTQVGAISYLKLPKVSTTALIRHVGYQ